MEVGAGDEASRLEAGTAEKQAAPGRVKRLCEFLEGSKARGIERGHVSQSQDHNRRERVDLIEDRTQFVGRSEQERAMYPENSDIRGNRLILENVDLAFADVVVGDGAHGRRVSDTLDEQQGGAHHPNTNGLR